MQLSVLRFARECFTRCIAGVTASTKRSAVRAQASEDPLTVQSTIERRPHEISLCCLPPPGANVVDRDPSE